MTAVVIIRMDAQWAASPIRRLLPFADSIGAINKLCFKPWRLGSTVHFANAFFGGSVVTLDAGSLETDVLDYLCRRYAAERLIRSLACLKRRQAKPAGSFIRIGCAASRTR